MAEKTDVVALGELLIDFTENGVSNQGNGLFEACPGGAPCNVLAMLRKLGKSCAFVGKVGDDMFGLLLWHTILEAGIRAEHLIMDPKIPTTLAFVKPFSNGDRDFSFYRKPGADMMLTEDELPEETIANAKIFHFGTLSMTYEGVRAATVKAVKLAKEGGAYISFDPNLRPPLWEDLAEAKRQIAWGLSQCDILKIADNELEFMTGETDFEKGARILQKAYPNIRVLNVTAGADGSYSFCAALQCSMPGCSARAASRCCTAGTKWPSSTTGTTNWIRIKKRTAAICTGAVSTGRRRRCGGMPLPYRERSLDLCAGWKPFGHSTRPSARMPR